MFRWMLSRMAEVVLTDDERNRIAGILQELGGTIDDFFVEARSALTCDEWTVLVEYATARLRRVLEIGTALHAVVDANEHWAPPYAGRGRESFVRAALAAWRDSFTAIQDPWRLAFLFDKVPGGERSLLADVATLETMAANRLFSSLDDQCERMLASEG